MLYQCGLLYNFINKMDHQEQIFSMFYMVEGCGMPAKQETQEKQEQVFNLTVFLEKEKEVVVVPITQTDIAELGCISKKKKWSQQQDRKLLKLTRTPEHDWEQIALQFPNRNPKMCYNRYRRLENTVERAWTAKDDQLIMSLVDTYGEDWNKIKQSFPKRNEKQIRDHYKNYLRPDLDKSQWDIQTDLEFLRLLAQYGCDWVTIQKHMPERPYPQIKNRYYGRIAKIIAKKLDIPLK